MAGVAAPAAPWRVPDSTPVAPGPGAAPAATPPLLHIDGIGKRFGALQALGDVSLSLRRGEVHGLLGENGAGKSTLCNIVFGIHAPDAGALSVDGAPYRPKDPADALRHRIAMVHQHFSLVDDLPVVDNLLLGQARGVLRRREYADRIADLSRRYGLGLEPFKRIDELTVGERQRVEIVKCLMREPRLLVLDEPTAVLLPEEIRSLLQLCRQVASEGCGIVLVTHKLAEIREVAQRATVLRGGRVVARSDAPDREIDDLVRAMIGRTAGERPGGAGSECSRATPAPAPANRPAADPALMLDGIGVRDADGVERVSNFTLTVEPGEIVAVAGVEGNGQSELGAVIAGMRPPTSGRWFVGGREVTRATPRELTQVGVGVVPEDRHAVGCVLEMSVAENLFLDQLHRYRRHGALDRTRLERDAADLMQRFDVRAKGPGAPFASLSGGNQQKAVLARELTRRPLRFLLAAHPTRGLDVGAVEAVYDHVRSARAQGVGVLLISSELDELLGVADRLVVMYRGRLMGTCPAEPAERERIGGWMAGHAA
ncbi:MAG TPA: ABC transporter ATP-binding protein [Burkholderiaceae bacterium]|nr:ABC transporter ATP-binding protein [Burkholderiaceae bacterium]